MFEFFAKLYGVVAGAKRHGMRSESRRRWGSVCSLIDPRQFISVNSREYL